MSIEQKYTSLLASTYVPLVTDFPVPGNGTGNLADYINTVVTFAIGIAGVLAVVMIIIGGVQYVSTDSWSNKDDGKKRIQAALGGLILALSSYLILNTIDPNLTKLTFKVETVTGLETTGGGITIINEDYEVNESVFVDPSDTTGGIVATSSIPIQVGNECESLPAFRAKGRVSARDKSGYTGTISPEIAWLSSVVSTKWPGLNPSSTYRSLKHNLTNAYDVAASKADQIVSEINAGGDRVAVAAKYGVKRAAVTSAHVRGEAVDFFGPGINNGQAAQAVAWALKDVCGIGIRQVIFGTTGYNIGGGTFTATGHENHVHIGR